MSKGKILIIYLDKDLRKMFEIYFTGQGYEVVCAEDRASALELVTFDNMADAIIIKEGVSGTDGYELREALQHIDSTKFIPIVFITYKFTVEKIEEPESVYDDFVTMPFDIEELELRVRNAIKRSRQNG